MKIRTDFVTNSSSSSFVLARKGEFSKEQEKAILDIIKKKMFGEPVLTPESTEEEIVECLESYEEMAYCENRVRAALKDGKTVYTGMVIFDCGEDSMTGLMEDIWSAASRAGDLDVINGELGY